MAIISVHYNFILTSNCSQSLSVCMYFIVQILLFLGMYLDINCRVLVFLIILYLMNSGFGSNL